MWVGNVNDARDLRSVLERIRQPVLVIHGARDAVVPLAAGEYLARALPNAPQRRTMPPRFCKTKCAIACWSGSSTSGIAPR